MAAGPAGSSSEPPADASSSCPSIFDIVAESKPRPLFPDEPVRYMQVETGDGHLFLIDEHAAATYSNTFRFMIQTERSLVTVGRPAAAPLPYKFNEVSAPCMDWVMRFFYWKKRWANVVTEKIPEFPVCSDLALCQELLVASSFFEC